MPMAAVADWTVVGAIGLLDIVWLWRAGIALRHAGLYLAGIAVLVAVATLARQRPGGQRLAQWARVMALYLAFLLTAETCSFLSGMVDRPFRDELFVAIDHRLGFDWPAWAARMAAWPRLEGLLTAIYFSYVPQFVFALTFYALRGREARSLELLWQLMIAFVLAMLLFMLLPAAGPWAHFGVADKLDSFPVRYLAALRGHGLQVIDVLQIEGVVTFPSFHAVYAVLLCYVHRGHRALLPGALALNGAMLLSLPVPGGHYLVDIAAGLAIGGVAVAAAPVTRAAAARLLGRFPPLVLTADRLRG